MRIALNAIFLQDRPEGYGHYVMETFQRIVTQHPEHEFVFVFDRAFAPKFIFASNVTGIIVKPAARHPLAFKYWYDVKAPLALRKLNIDVWIQPYGFCSLTTKIPQVLMVHDLAFLHYPQYISRINKWYYKKYTPKFLRKAKTIVTVSEFSKKDIIEQYGTAGDKIKVISGAAKSGFVPLSWFGREEIKEKYSGGKEFFLFIGGIHPRKNLLNLLKAFSLFKKWQHSNMQLLVAGRLAWQYDDILDKLKTYKYRNDVVMLDYVSDEELCSITASAYALVYPSFFEGFGLPVIETMQSGVPVIASNSGSLPETGDDAALYADPSDADAIAKQMLLLYKDEAKREQLINAGTEQAKKFSWDTTAEQFWQTIVSAAGK